jgi:transcriptional regulator with XRE-family HTH domain
MTAAAAHDMDDAGPLRMQVADEVRAWLGRRRMSGAQLAREMGKSQTFIARRLDGRQAFDIDDLEMVASVLRVPVVAFLAPQPGGVTDAHIRRYPPATSGLAPVIPLVRESITGYPPVPPGYGSSAAEKSYGDGPIVGDPSGEVHNAHAA